MRKLSMIVVCMIMTTPSLHAAEPDPIPALRTDLEKLLRSPSCDAYEADTDGKAVEGFMQRAAAVADDPKAPRASRAHALLLLIHLLENRRALFEFAEGTCCNDCAYPHARVLEERVVSLTDAFREQLAKLSSEDVRVVCAAAQQRVPSLKLCDDAHDTE